MKTIERAHLPSQLWDKIKLSNNLKDALNQIDQHLMYWPAKMILKVKQRYTKISQYLIRMRKLRKKLRPTVIAINQKVERRERTREEKAISAAAIEKQIKKELLERLNTSGTYGDIYNFAPETFNEVLDETAYADEIEDEDEFVMDDDYDEEEGLEDGDMEDFELFDKLSSDGSEADSEPEDAEKSVEESDDGESVPKRKKRVRFKEENEYFPHDKKKPKKKTPKKPRMYYTYSYDLGILKLLKGEEWKSNMKWRTAPAALLTSALIFVSINQGQRRLKYSETSIMLLSYLGLFIRHFVRLFVFKFLNLIIFPKTFLLSIWTRRKSIFI